MESFASNKQKPRKASYFYYYFKFFFTRIVEVRVGRGKRKQLTRKAIRTEKGDFPGGSVVKNPPANAGDTGSSPVQDPTCRGATKPVHHNY